MLSHAQALIMDSDWTDHDLKDDPLIRWQRAIEDAGILMWEADATTLACRAMAGPVEDLLGFSAGCFTAQPQFWLSRLLDGDEAILRAAASRAVTTGEKQSVIVRMLAADDRLVRLRATMRAYPAIDESGLMLRGTLADLGESRDAPLPAAPTRLLSDSPVQLWMINAAGQRQLIRTAHDAFHPHTPNAGDDWSDAMHPEDRDGYRQAYDTAFHAGAPFEQRYRSQLRGESYRPIYERGDPCFDRDGALVGYAGYTVDIHALRCIVLGETHSAEEQGAMAEAEALRRSDRLKSEFIASVSHELRTPLHHIKGYASTLLRPRVQFDNDTVQEYLRIIVEETNHLERLIADILDTSHIERQTLSLDIDSVRIDEIARKVVSRWALNGTHNFELILPAEVPPVPADPYRIEQVFNNLLSNVVRYTPSNTLTTVSLDVRRGEIEVCVRDRGPGVPEAHLSHLFERFYRVESDIRRAQRGSGLGLFICKGIVEQHGGRIWVALAPEGGTIFGFTIPRRRGSVRS
jgi:signal transduction histidine kinase